MLNEVLGETFATEKITAYAPLAYADCREMRPYLRERLPFVPRTAVLFLIPYYAGETENLSRYAAAGDYHAYATALFARVCPGLREKTGYSFAGFADHAPIDERAAAFAAGLGLRGENGLVIHKDYGSYVFLAELLTDAPPEVCGARPPREPVDCTGCGACRAACPGGILRGAGMCLSAVTQKKGELTPEEERLVRGNGSVWGCDVCQDVCPHNKRAIAAGTADTPIPFFRENRITRLTRPLLDGMGEEEFARRAFSFRGRAPLERNLAILEEEDT